MLDVANDDVEMEETELTEGDLVRIEVDGGGAARGIEPRNGGLAAPAARAGAGGGARDPGRVDWGAEALGDAAGEDESAESDSIAISLLTARTGVATARTGLAVRVGTGGTVSAATLRDLTRFWELVCVSRTPRFRDAPHSGCTTMEVGSSRYSGSGMTSFFAGKDASFLTSILTRMLERAGMLLDPPREADVFERIEPRDGEAGVAGTESSLLLEEYPSVLSGTTEMSL